MPGSSIKSEEPTLPISESDSPAKEQKPASWWTRTCDKIPGITYWRRFSDWQKNKWPGIKIPTLIILIIIILALWWVPPSGLGIHTWQVFVTFLVTIIGAVTEPLPMSGICLVSLGFCTVTNILTTSQILSGFGNDTVWLIVFACFIASGFVTTGLGKRLCFIILKYIGSTTLGLAYAFCICEFILAMAIPSSTARGAGILLPILEPLLKEGFQSDPALGTQRRIGSYMIMVEIIANTTSSVCWLTGGAWNAMMANFMSDVGVHLSWGQWAYSMAPPGILPLIYGPLIMYFFYPPEIKKTPQARKLADDKLAEMGRIGAFEIVMALVFLMVIILWIVSSSFDTVPYSTTGVAILGLSVLLMTGIIDVKRDIVANKGAWDLFLWFGVLLMLATELKETGFFEWFATLIDLSSVPAYASVWICTAIFYVSQYLFASITAHVSAMFPVFLQIMQRAGVPMQLGARALAYTTLSGHLTQYTSSTNPPYYNLGYVPMERWWLQGLIVMIVNLIVLNTVCWGYWWLLGFW
ncbi:hypothetical protein FOL47_003753 [Perkinsus chesapeaki]|uniref:Uncharacterized protein n=2 Tax=Alveolata TaxID=33630 RepID=A0A7J6N0Q9_PERCH|nr:hypothetical protein FOL47_003753 [Perkinsus chesapeaki]